jgi:acetoin utilization deacetylase AcuC-like enzyme
MLRGNQLRVIFAAQHRLHDPANAIIDGKRFASEDSPDRAENILQAVLEPPFGPVCAPEDHGLLPIQSVHDPDYLVYLQTAYQHNAESMFLTNASGQTFTVIPETFAPHGRRHRPGGFLGLPGYYCFGVGTPLLEHTWEAAYWSAQCALTAADAVRSGEPAAYAICRPPGHHAASNLYGGLCYLNNAAITARYLQDGEQTQVAIIDIDYHHGNGTQEIFYADPSVLYVSLHAHPDDDYPYYWGMADEIGEGAGLGFNRNFPLPQGTEDEAYLVTLDQALAVIRGFSPRWLVVSAGFDTALGDPIGGFRLTEAGLAEVGRRIAGLALPTVIIQEGGYLVQRLGENAAVFLRNFAL